MNSLLEQLIEDKLRRYEDVPAEFLDITDKIQHDILKEIIEGISNMDTKDGYLVVSDFNMGVLDELINRVYVDNIIDRGDYQEALKQFINQFDVQGDLTDEIFNRIVDGFKIKDTYRKAIRIAQERAITALRANPLYSQVIEPIKTQLIASMQSGEAIGSAAARISEFIVGNEERLGSLKKYANTISYDVFAISDRAYGETIAKDLNLEFYYYQGGVIRDTREFCLERVGGYYHRKEVEEWAKLDWAGKALGTNESTIFVYLGGYNCKHGLIPVPISAVPPSDLNRAIKMGYIRATEVSNIV